MGAPPAVDLNANCRLGFSHKNYERRRRWKKWNGEWRVKVSGGVAKVG